MLLSRGFPLVVVQRRDCQGGSIARQLAFAIAANPFGSATSDTLERMAKCALARVTQ